MASKRPGEDGENGHDNGDGASDAKKAKPEGPPSGTLLFSGATDWEDVGRKTTALPRSPNTIWKPVRLAALKDVKVVAVSSGPSSVHMFAVADDGKVYGWGRNEKGQLGLGDTKDRKCPALVTALSDYKIVKAATGKNHSLFLTGECSLCFRICSKTPQKWRMFKVRIELRFPVRSMCPFAMSFESQSTCTT